MIVRCVECGSTVSEWAARCSRCAHPVEDSLAAAAAAEPVVEQAPDGSRIAHGLILGDGPVDPETAGWSRTAPRPVWEPTGPSLTPPAPLAPPLAAPASWSTASPTPAPVPVVDGSVPDDSPRLADVEPAEPAEPEPAPRRGRWIRLAAVLGAVAAVVTAVVMLTGGGQGSEPAEADPFFLTVPAVAPEPRWSAELDLPVFSVSRTPGTVYVLAGLSNDEPGVLIALDEVTGEERWRATLAESVFGVLPVVPSPTGVIVTDTTTRGWSLVGYDAQTGEERWRTPEGVTAYGVRAGDRMLALLIGASRRGQDTPEVVVLDTATGALGESLGELEGLAGSLVLVRAGSSDEVMAIDSSGVERGRWPRPPGFNSATIVDDLLVVSRPGELEGWDRDGRRWSIEVDVSDSTALRAVGETGVAIQDYGRQQLTYVELGPDSATARWDKRVWAADFFGDSAALVTLGEAASLQPGPVVVARLDPNGLEELVELGDAASLQLGQAMFGGAVVVEGAAVRAYDAEGALLWEVDSAVGVNGTVQVVDGAFAVMEDRTIQFFG